MSLLKSLPAALFSVGMLGVALPAHADEIADLKAAVQQLQAVVAQLKAQRSAPAATAAVPAGAIVVTAAPVPQPLGRNAGAALTPVQNVMSLKMGANSFTFYGDADQFFNTMRANGKTINAVNDGALLKSRVGLVWNHDAGEGYKLTAQLEQALNFQNGNNTDTSRLFDRQAWAGLSTPYGEIRVGRQNTAILYIGNYVDYTERTMGSVVNDFGVPSRFDGDIAYIAPRIGGLQFQIHDAVGASNQTLVAGQSADQSLMYGNVAQIALDYLNGPWRVGYAGIRGRSTVGAGDVYYHDVYGNYDYGRGTIYANFVRSNNEGGPLPGAGGSVVGGNSNLAVKQPSDYYDIYQLSADYRVSPTLRVGALYGWIRNSTNSSKDATGASIGAYWDAITNLTLYGLVDELKNSSQASFGFADSAGSPYKNFVASDLMGQNVTGVQLGALYRF